MADRVILMRDGRIEQDAEPEELYERPASTFVARFVGSPPMNLIDLAQWKSTNSKLPAGCQDVNPQVLVGVRPEHVEISANADGAAQVLSVEYLGVDSIVTCAIGEQNMAVRHQGHSRFVSGQRVDLMWQSEHTHLFDRETGLKYEEIASQRRASAASL